MDFVESEWGDQSVGVFQKKSSSGCSSLKISSGVSTAILSATLSMEGKHVTSAEGIIDEDVDKSIRNLTSIGKEAMCITDDMVLNIMTHKCN